MPFHRHRKTIQKPLVFKLRIENRCHSFSLQVYRDSPYRLLIIVVMAAQSKLCSILHFSYFSEVLCFPSVTATVGQSQSEVFRVIRNQFGRGAVGGPKGRPTDPGDDFIPHSLRLLLVC